MARFSFLQRGENLPELARDLQMETYSPAIVLEGLLTGVDNVRHDVFLSLRFAETARLNIFRLIAKYGAVEELVREDPQAQRPPSVMQRAEGSGSMKPYKGPDAADFRPMLTALHTVALNRAKTESNISVDLLARLALIKFLKTEMLAQFHLAVERCRAKLKTYEGPRTPNPAKAMELRERFAQFQVSKKALLRRVGQELFQTLRDVEKETLARLRRSLFGDGAAEASYELFLNRLLLTEDGRDDFLNAEHYVMLGNYERDPDRFQTLLEIAASFFKSLELDGADEERRLDALFSAPNNAEELLGGGTPDESTSKGKAQKALLAAWVDLLERENVMEHIIASYEAVPLLPQYSPPINPQQLKNALISSTERKRVETLLQEHGKISPDNLHKAVKRLDACKGTERGKVAGRFLRDFIRYHRDLRRLEALDAAMEGVNVITTEKLRQLSAINNTLYEFLLPEEQKPVEDRVVHHVVIKADIRESSILTRTLSERGLNPASYFSLNFYEPVNKLLPKYGADKVFIEGDAVILALFEREGESGFGVGRACVLAKEITEIVRAYNQKSQQAGLPTLELGIGISYQESPPMYLMDGPNRIMISGALNESDRLSSCSRGSRRYLNGAETLFNVYNFQTVDDEDTGGNPEEFLLRYNIGGIHINEAAFQKLSQEISLQAHDLTLPTIWDQEVVRLYSGLVPVAQGSFHRVVVRQGRIPHVEARDFTLKQWTDRLYYEICTNPAIYEYVEHGVDAPSPARSTTV